MTVLTTERLTLRPPEPEDFEAYRAFYASDAVRFIGGRKDLAEAWRLFAADAGHWALKGFGWFTMLDADGPVGSTGVHHPPNHAEIEVGWNTYERGQGKGYATEAARAVLAWAWGLTDAVRIVSYIDMGNEASKAVARKLGAENTGARAAHDPDCEIWAHGRPS